MTQNLKWQRGHGYVLWQTKTLINNKDSWSFRFDRAKQVTADVSIQVLCLWGEEERGHNTTDRSSGVGWMGEWKRVLRVGCSVRGGIGFRGGHILAGLRLCSGRWGRGRGGRGRGGGLLLAVIVIIVVRSPPALLSALPPQVVGGQWLLQHCAVLAPVLQAELPQSLQQMSRCAATSLLTLLLLLSPRKGLRWHARGQTLQARSMVSHTYTYTHNTHITVTITSTTH